MPRYGGSHSAILSFSCFPELRDKLDALVDFLEAQNTNPLKPITRASVIRELVEREVAKYQFEDKETKSIEEILGV